MALCGVDWAGVWGGKGRVRCSLSMNQEVLRSNRCFDFVAVVWFVCVCECVNKCVCVCVCVCVNVKVFVIAISVCLCVFVHVGQPVCSLQAGAKNTPRIG